MTRPADSRMARTSERGMPPSITKERPRVRGLPDRSGRRRNAGAGTVPDTRGLFTMVRELVDVAATIRSAPGWTDKAHIAVVREVFGPGDWLRGPGDDGAVVAVGGEAVIACGEAILPDFVERDPYGAGVAGGGSQEKDLPGQGGGSP